MSHQLYQQDKYIRHRSCFSGIKLWAFYGPGWVQYKLTCPRMDPPQYVEVHLDVDNPFYQALRMVVMDTIYFKQLTLKASVSVILKFPLKYGKWLLFPLFRFGSFHFAGEYFSQFSTDFENSCSSKILGQNSIKIQIFASIGAFLLSLMDEHKKRSKKCQNPIQIWLFFPNFRPMMWLLQWSAFSKMVPDYSYYTI